MSVTISTLLFFILGIGIGALAFYAWNHKNQHKLSRGILAEAQAKAKDVAAAAERKAQKTIQEAKEKNQLDRERKLVEVKDKFVSLRKQLDEEVSARTAKIQDGERQLKERETQVKSQEQRLGVKEEELDAKQQELGAMKETLTNQLKVLEAKQTEVDALLKQEQSQLENISGLSVDEAKEQLLESVRTETKDAALKLSAEIIEEAKMNAQREAKNIIIKTIQRTASEEVIENSVSTFPLEDETMKGRIIGREGRNIRALEAATGAEIVVDDTPDAIVISCFDPIRREVARLSLHQLVQDGRIHPGRIEEVVTKIRKQLENEINEEGKRTIIDLGIHGLHPALVRLVGKMKYRSSYGQNLLMHARETANLCAIMASELGLNPKVAKRAGLLHDIGKVSDEEPELPHAILGAKLCEKFGEKPEVCNAVGSHHDEIEMTSLVSPIVQVCDAISGARPGARHELVEAYIKRLQELEQLALSFPGVTKTYAIQAGRELRVIVGSEHTDDATVSTLSHEIAQKVQDEMTYPGQVKVTVIRETRSVSIAK